MTAALALTPLNPSVRFTGLDDLTVVWVPTIADINAPTAAELIAGTDLTGEVPPDGISGFSTTGATVDAPSFGSGFTAQLSNGYSAGSSSIKVYMSQDGATTDIRTLLKRGDKGFVVLGDTNGGLVPGDLMDVYPAEVLSCEKSRAGGDAMTVTVSFSIYSAPAENVTVPADGS